MRNTANIIRAKTSSSALLLVILIAAAILPYSNIFPNQFTFDDFDFFVRWDGVKSLKNIPSFFSGDLPIYHQHAYRPVRSVLQSVVYTLSNGQPFGFHIFSLLLQVAGVVMIFLITRTFLKPTIAFVTALVFAVLPIHVNSLTFMTASFDTAGSIIGLGSFYAYLLYRNNQKYWLYILSLILALIAFFSYEMMLVLPLFILLYDIFVKENTYREIVSRWKLYTPYVVGILFYLTVRASIVGSVFTGSLLEPIPLMSRIFTMLKAFILYIYLTVVGTPLSIAHNVPIESSIASPKVILSLITLLRIAAIAIYLFRTGRKLFAFSIVWFFIALLPVSNIVPIATFTAENYLYVASFGWALLVGLLFEKLLKKLRSRNAIILIWTFLFILLSVYAYLSFDRNKDWRDSSTIFNAAISLDPEYAGGYNGLAFQYRLQKDYENAEYYAKKAIEINPNYYISYALLGEVQMEQEKCDEAIPYFTQALEINDSYASGYLNRGVCFFNLERFDEAESDFLKALEIYPGYNIVHRNLGTMYSVTGEFDKAILHLKQIDSGSEDAGVEHLLGVSLINIGMIDDGKKHLENVLLLSPGHKDTIKILENISR